MIGRSRRLTREAGIRHHVGPTRGTHHGHHRRRDRDRPGTGRRVGCGPEGLFTHLAIRQADVAVADMLGLNVATATKPVPHTARGWLHGVGNDGLIKLVVDTDRNVLVGATSAGPHGGEVLGLLTLAVHAEISIATLRSMIYAYPTFHKGIEDALNELG